MGFLKLHHLPCRHIFAVRQYLKIDLFNNHLCASRWTREYFQKSHRVFCSHVCNVSEVNVSTINSSAKILSQQGNYRKVYSIALKLANLASDINSREFGYALSRLSLPWNKVSVLVVEVLSCDANDKADENAIVFTDDAENPINNTIYAGVEDVSEVHIEDDAYNDDHHDVDNNEIYNIHDPTVKDVSNNRIDDDDIPYCQG